VPKVAPDVAFRKGLEERVAKGQAKALFQELKMVDPAAADNIDPRNVRRVIRALEVNKLSKILLAAAAKTGAYFSNVNHWPHRRP